MKNVALLVAALAFGCAPQPYVQSPPQTKQAAPPPKPAPKPRPNFCYEKVALLKTGMPEAEVVSLFGPPDSMEIATMGSKTPKPWTGKVYKYKVTGTGRILEPANRFTFARDDDTGEWYLNDYEIEVIQK